MLVLNNPRRAYNDIGRAAFPVTSSHRTADWIKFPFQLLPCSPVNTEHPCCFVYLCILEYLTDRILQLIFVAQMVLLYCFNFKGFGCGLR